MNIENVSLFFMTHQQHSEGAVDFMNNTCKKYDIFYVNLFAPRAENCVQNGYRPAIIVSNNNGNEVSPIVTVVPITSKKKRPLPTHVSLRGYGLNRISTALCEQTTCIDKSQIMNKVGTVTNPDLQEAINQALKIQLAL